MGKPIIELSDEVSEFLDLGVALALLGVLSPLVAAILMPLSSLTVVSSALRSRAFREEP